MRKIGKKVASILLVTAMTTTCFTGCAKGFDTQINVVHELNETKAYETAIVEKGMVSANYSFSLKMQGYKKKNYNVSTYGSVVDEILVTEGDFVHAGDVLIRFKSQEAIENKVDYEAKIEENKLLIEHYKNLMKADKNLDYKDEIEILEDDNVLNELYIKQYETQIAFNEIKAETDSYVTYIYPFMHWGIEPSTVLAMTIAGSDIFVATFEDEYEFKVGDVYKASYNKTMTYEVTVESVGENEDGLHEVTFRSKDKDIMITGGELLTIDILDDNAAIDACYIEKKYLYTNKEDTFVYILDDKGQLSVRNVVVDRIVNDIVAITSGVSEGEKVAIYK